MRATAAGKDGVEFIELPIPEPEEGEVRVAIKRASVNAGEQKVIDGDFVGRFLRSASAPLVLGWDFAGKVDAVGKGVYGIDRGARVWGHLPFSPDTDQGTFSEYIVIKRSEIGELPDGVSDDVAAAAPTVAMTALQSLRDHGQLGEGRHALIIGAAGGIGSVGVGISKRLGGKVTAVCSAKDVDRVRGLGADEVLDRRETNPFGNGRSYDVIFDTPAAHSFGHVTGSLVRGGTYVTTLPSLGLFPGMVRGLLTGKRCRFVQVASRRADLELVAGWLDDGLEVPIDSTFPISELQAALDRQQDRDRAGRVVVDVAGGWV
ncbi:MAG: NAD(P)-dependent alcohol dehydrogenase [Rhodothermales bacterium]|nr:NAD(P)-dependent alcohol dehydrogenase [Rhodothermales bacterium]